MTLISPDAGRLGSDLPWKAAEGQRQAGDIVGLLGSCGEGGGCLQDSGDQIGRAKAARRVQCLLQTGGAEFVSGRVKRLGYAVAEQKQRVARTEHGLGNAVADPILDAERDSGG